MSVAQVRVQSLSLFNQYAWGPWCPPRNLSDRELLRVVREFRRGLLGGLPPLRCCFLSCAPLVGYLAAVAGIRARLTRGEVWGVEHYWLGLPDGRILDPTASQFEMPDGGRMPSIYLGDKPRWYKADQVRAVVPAIRAILGPERQA